MAAEDAQDRPDPGADAGSEATEDAPDVRAKFREALERKQTRHHASVSAEPGDDSKSHGGSGPARSQRQFRRKSGG